jgi:hypothetical protein
MFAEIIQICFYITALSFANAGHDEDNFCLPEIWVNVDGEALFLECITTRDASQVMMVFTDRGMQAFMLDEFEYNLQTFDLSSLRCDYRVEVLAMKVIFVQILNFLRGYTVGYHLQPTIFGGSKPYIHRRSCPIYLYNDLSSGL